MRGWDGPRMPSRGALQRREPPQRGKRRGASSRAPGRGSAGPDQQRFHQQPQVCPLASQARRRVSVLVQQLQETGQRPKQPSCPPPSSVGRTVKSRKAQVSAAAKVQGCVSTGHGGCRPVSLPAGAEAEPRGDVVDAAGQSVPLPALGPHQMRDGDPAGGASPQGP